MKPVSPKMRAVLQDLVEAKGLFSRQMSTSSRISTIERFASSDEVAAIPYLTPLLADNATVASAASRGIAFLLQCAGSDNFPEIDVQVRHWIGHDIKRAWKDLRLNDIWRVEVDDETRTAALAS